MTDPDKLSEQCSTILAAAVWALARQEKEEFVRHLDEISRLGLSEQVHGAYQKLLQEPSRVSPAYVFDESARGPFGFYALVAKDDAHREYIVASLVAGIPVPVADACMTKRGQEALSTIANVSFMATDRRGMAALLDNVRREPFNREGRDMLDWLIGVGDYAAQRLEGFENFQARVESNLAMVQATQALLAIEAARNLRTRPAKG